MIRIISWHDVRPAAKRIGFAAAAAGAFVIVVVLAALLLVAFALREAQRGGL